MNENLEKLRKLIDELEYEELTSVTIEEYVASIIKEYISIKNFNISSNMKAKHYEALFEKLSIVINKNKVQEHEY